jgi:activator of HSP90 ATPase
MEGFMTPVIKQRVRFRASPKALFELYRDSRRHSLATGAPALISRKVGGKFKAFSGQLDGRNLLIIPEKQIVQLWRTSHWKQGEWPTLILTFSPAPGGAQIELVTWAFPNTITGALATAGQSIIASRGKSTSPNPE